MEEAARRVDQGLPMGLCRFSAALGDLSAKK
jgi:hypothetical protein